VQSDAELVRAVLEGQRGSFEVLVRRHERAVLGSALAILGDHHAAQDAAQDAFVTAYRRLATLRVGARFAPWILRIVRNRAIRLRQQRSQRQQQSLSTGVTAARVDSRPDERLDGLLAAVGRLPERQQQLIMLRYFDGLSVQEIAEATGRPVGTVTKYLSRAHRRLRQLLGELKQ
jgi:RNA polymerase sigma-70 factor (ECF subfamily)